MRFLRATERADKAAFRMVSQQLAQAKKYAHRVGSTSASVANVTRLSSEALTLRQTIQDDAAAIRTNRQADRVTIHSARRKLATDLRAFRRAMYQAEHKKAA